MWRRRPESRKTGRHDDGHERAGYSRDKGSVLLGQRARRSGVSSGKKGNLRGGHRRCYRDESHEMPGPSSETVTQGPDQKGFTTARKTITITAIAGISFMMRQNFSVRGRSPFANFFCAPA